MGWYLRKSLNLGPIRFNLSKSGVGMSAGVKGLRVGTGPSGKYLHAGREGLYYRTSLGSHADQAVQEAANAELDPPLNDLTEEKQLAAARSARITARAERLHDPDRGTERGFFSSLVGGIFGGLLRGR
jgi:hypothetical protein